MIRFLIALLVVGVFGGCLKGNDNTNFTCNYSECGLTAPATEIDSIKKYLAANGILNATQHCSGLFYIIGVPGSGNSPTVCNNIGFTYEGRLLNGTVFGGSTTPVVIPLSQLIAGFKNGIPHIKPGGSMRLFVPPSLGYGNSPPPNSSIPANAYLIFDVTLVSVQ